MNTLKKRLISLALLTCFAFTSAVGCSSNDSSNSEKGYTSGSDVQNGTAAANNASPADDVTIAAITNEEGNPIIMPIQSGSINGGNVTADNGMNLNGPDPESVDSSPEPATESVTVVDENGEPVTESVEVTNASGETVTEANGQPVTEFVPVTSISKADNTSVENYTSNTQGQYILWVDISKDENFFFNDQFIKVTFKIKDNIPEGDYPITLVTDFSSISGVSIEPDKVVNGTIRVGGSKIAAADVSSESGFVVYGDNVNAKPGEEVEFYINCKNNPGLAAILMWFYYDSNAMDFVDLESVGEFGDIAANPSTGKKGQ
jgi:hypothetical protein